MLFRSLPSMASRLVVSPFFCTHLLFFRSSRGILALRQNILVHTPCRSYLRTHIGSIGESDPSKIIKVMANEGKSGEPHELAYTNCKVIGNGSFGVVFQAKLVSNGEDAAIKKVLQDKRFKVRLSFQFTNNYQSLDKKGVVTSPFLSVCIVPD